MACTLKEYLDGEYTRYLGEDGLCKCRAFLHSLYEDARDGADQEGKTLNEGVFKDTLMFYSLTMIKMSEQLRERDLGKGKVRTFFTLRQKPSRVRVRGTKGRGTKGRGTKGKVQKGGVGAARIGALLTLAFTGLLNGFLFYNSIVDFHIAVRVPPFVDKQIPGIRADMNKLFDNVRGTPEATVLKGSRFDIMAWLTYIQDVADNVSSLIGNFVYTQLSNTMQKSLLETLYDVTLNTGSSCIADYNLVFTYDNLMGLIDMIPELQPYREGLMITYLEKNPMQGIEEGTLPPRREQNRARAQQTFNTVKRLAGPNAKPNGKSNGPKPQAKASWSFRSVLSGMGSAASGAAASAHAAAVFAYAAPSTLADLYHKLKNIDAFFANDPVSCMYETTTLGVSLASQKITGDKLHLAKALLGWGTKVGAQSKAVVTQGTYLAASLGALLMAIVAVGIDFKAEKRLKLETNTRFALQNAAIHRKGALLQNLAEEMRQIRAQVPQMQLMGQQQMQLMGQPLQLMNAERPLQIMGQGALVRQASIAQQAAEQAVEAAEVAAAAAGPLVFEQPDRGMGGHLRGRRQVQDEISIAHVIRNPAIAPFLVPQGHDEGNPERFMFTTRQDIMAYGRNTFLYSLSLRGSVSLTAQGTVYRQGNQRYLLGDGNIQLI
jgi:hypothetical protein